jgi:uncharacterized YigZ family protein
MMEQSDTYRTIKKPSDGIFKDRGSKFLSFAFPVSSPEEIKTLLADHRKIYHDARHHCYAYIVGADKNSWRANDDGEPSGTAGKPILGQLNSFELTNILVIVTRYFGGTLLGTSGLINAYKSATYEALSKAEIILCTVNEYYKLEFPYSEINNVMKVIKEENLNQSEQVFETDCSLNINFRLASKEVILKKLNEIEKISITFLKKK